MNKIEPLNSRLETLAWGLLLFFWGLCIFFDPIPFGAGVAGTGLILLGLNGIRSLYRIPPRPWTTSMGILLLAWGGLELLRPFAGPVLHLAFPLNDWAIFAILLMLCGAMLLVSAIRHAYRSDNHAPSSGS